MLDNSQEIATVKSINYDEIEDTNIKLDIIHKYVDRIWVEKIEPRTYTLEFEYKTCIIPQAGKYRYYSAGGHIKVYRINQDEIEDLLINV